jgi:hypothetical protein
VRRPPARSSAEAGVANARPQSKTRPLPAFATPPQSPVIRGAASLDGICEPGHVARVNVQRIRDLIIGGFEPFVIRMSDGRTYDVPHPEFVAVGQGVVVVIGQNDRVNTLDPFHITAVEKRFASDGDR